jgi:hypothetical protein
VICDFILKWDYGRCDYGTRFNLILSPRILLTFFFKGLPTPFLDDTSNSHSKTFCAPPPSTAGLPSQLSLKHLDRGIASTSNTSFSSSSSSFSESNNSFVYNGHLGFPSRLNRQLIGSVRK